MRSRKLRFLVNAPIILRGLGLIVQVAGWMALLSLPVALFFREHYAVLPLLITAGVSLALGWGAYWAFRRAGETTLAHGMIISSLGWLLIPILGALPFYLIALLAREPGVAQGTAAFTQPLNAFFEGMSGFTGTGLTMVLRPEDLPRTLQWWRSFMQWVGGIGVILFMLALVSGPGTYSLYYAEARAEKIHPSIRSTVRTIWWIFLLYTGASILLLWIAGMPVWDAINHGMTGIATGGFSTRSNSIAYYGNFWLELALLPVMIMGALSFAVHYQWLSSRKFRTFWEDSQSRWFLVILAGGIVFLGLENLLRLPPLAAFREAGFQFTSALCTAGLQSTDLHGWSETGKLLLALAMVLGAAAGSTGGGIKVVRTLILARGIRWRLRKLIAPRNVLVPFRLGKQPLSDEQAAAHLIEAGVLLILWWAFLGIGVLVLLHAAPSGYSLGDVIFEVVSAQGNVGLSSGLTGPGLPVAAKLMLCLNMWLGRLEIIPILLLFRAIFRGLD
ncbi:MAG: TrkH family potassium uptake protein [Candidatus Acetothermia bacterium]|jgi:trk system potassium uptake protein TrkH|nr:TrkH family potassium uptake protein [Candidatus Acetothermia bacterium]MDH7505762.1 TrkH family potassium uptake protein [Candidatus Acetothermia bacterium]